MIDIFYLQILSGILFVIGFVGILINRTHLIKILMSLQILLLAPVINFISFSYKLSDLTGHFATLFCLSIAVCQLVIGLSIFVFAYRSQSTLCVNSYSELKG